MNLLKHKQLKDERGVLLLIFIAVLPFIIAIAVYYSSQGLTSFQVAHTDQLQTEAQMAADSGADYSTEQLTANNNWAGTPSDITVQAGSTGNARTTFSSTIAGNASAKTLTVTGKTYYPASATTPTKTDTIALNLYPVTVGNYGIVAGAGGLQMSNLAAILGGSVFVDGGITMSNAAQIGLLIAPVNVQVADQLCPTSSPYTNYPSLCPAGSAQPIQINNLAHIYGSVIANNQTNDNGMSGPGLTNGSVAAQSLPTFDRSSFESTINSSGNTMTGAQASCSGLTTSMIWPANVKITGNVNIANTCNVDMKGNVWITGNLNISNTSSLLVDSSLGTTSPNVVVDGSGGITMSNAASVSSNLSGTGAHFYTFYCGSGCNVESNVTGAALKASQTLQTINISNLSAAVNSVFDAYWSEVNLSNSGQIGAVVGQTIVLSNTAAITFGSQASPGTSTWLIKGYRRE